MARFKEYDYHHTVMVPGANQILPGTYEYSLHYLVGNELDLSILDSRFRNDETGRRVYDSPSGLLPRQNFSGSSAYHPDRIGRHPAGDGCHQPRRRLPIHHQPWNYDELVLTIRKGQYDLLNRLAPLYSTIAVVQESVVECD